MRYAGTGVAAPLLGAFFAGVGAAPAAQDAPKTVTVADFESPRADWSAVQIEEGTAFGADSGAKLTLTREAADVRAGQAALRYAYQITPKTMRALMLTRSMNLSEMKSARFWVKSSHTTALLFGLDESEGGGYRAAFYCPAGAWQEIVLNLDELAPDDPKKDANGKLDLNSVAALTLSDLGHLLVNLLPGLKGERSLIVDDIVFSSRPAPLTTGVVKSAQGASLYRVDDFESPLIRWIPVSLELAEPPRISLFDDPLSLEAAGGKASLKYVYFRKAKKAQGLLRNVEKSDLKRVTGVGLRLKTARDGTFLVTIQEKDESRYQQIVTMKSADGWKNLSYTVGTFTLADDSRDENNVFDPGQIKEISITDVTALTGGEDSGENTFWVDDIQFALTN